MERGIKCSDEAIANESTSGVSKTWFYRGELYTQVLLDTVLNKKNENAAFEAINAFKKLDEINDPKFKDWEDAAKYLIPLATTVFNRGVDQYKDKNFALAYKYFYSEKTINTVLTNRKKNLPLDLGTAIKNAAVAAENANDTKDAQAAYAEWIALAPSANGYYSYAVSLKKSGDTVNAVKKIDEGLAKYPDDASLLGLKINSYIESADYAGALGYLNKLIAVMPDNDKALVAKGRAFASMNKEDSAIYYYKKAHEVNPKNADALTPIGDYYITQGNAIGEEINKLGNSADDTKKANELSAKKKALYLQAIPYYEDAAKLAPDDAAIKRILGKLKLMTGSE